MTFTRIYSEKKSYYSYIKDIIQSTKVGIIDTNQCLLSILLVSAVKLYDSNSTQRGKKMEYIRITEIVTNNNVH